MSKHGQIICKCSMSFVVKCRKYLAENFTYDEERIKLPTIKRCVSR